MVSWFQTVTEEEILAVYKSDVPTRKKKQTSKQTNKQTNNKTKQKQNKQNHAKKKEKREKKCKIRLGSIDKLDELLLYLVYEFIGDDRHRTILFTIAIYKNFEKATQVLF